MSNIAEVKVSKKRTTYFVGPIENYPNEKIKIVTSRFPEMYSQKLNMDDHLYLVIKPSNKLQALIHMILFIDLRNEINKSIALADTLINK